MLADKVKDALGQLSADMVENDLPGLEFIPVPKPEPGRCSPVLLISGENGCPLVDYYDEFGFRGEEKINKILKRFGLYLEWENAGLAGVYAL